MTDENKQFEQTTFLKTEEKEEKKEEIVNTNEIKVKTRVYKGRGGYQLKSKFVKLPEEVKVPVTSSDLVVVTKTKDLVNYIFKITDKSPKKFRFTFVNRMHNLGLDIIENLYRANEVDTRKGNIELFEERYYFQKEAMTNLKILEYVSQLAVENQCITFHQFEFIAKSGTNCLILLGNWINSDLRRKNAILMQNFQNKQ